MKKVFLIFISILAVSLTGCMKKYPLTEENTNVVAEYMAGLLLKYDKRYSSDLLSYQEMKETSDNAEDKEEVKNENKDETTQGIIDSKNDAVNEDKGSNKSEIKEYTLSEIIGENDFDIQYVGYRTADTLSDDKTNQVFSVDSRQGYQFFVVELSFENKTDSEKLLNLIKPDVKYLLNTNNKDTYKPQSVLLENNLLFINTNIKAGEKLSAILVFEVPKDTDLTNVNLVISNETMKKELQVN